MKIDFEFDTPYGVFRDALYLPDDHTFSDAEIQAIKEQRRDSWLAVVAAPPVDPSGTIREIDGVVYRKLEEAPVPGAKLLEIDGAWYYQI